MAGRFVRDSKLRNVFGQVFKKDLCYDSIKVSKHNNVQMFCVVNPKFLACVTHAAGGGSFLVLPHSKVGRVDVSYPQVMGHKAAVIDIAWSPFNDNLIASSDENGSIMLWEIPDGGLTSNMEEPLCEMDLHQKRCSVIRWHPTVENVLLSAGLDNKVYVWNLEDGEPILEVDVPELVQDMCWNLQGSLFALATKDKQIRLYNPRNGEVVKTIKGHDSPREMRIVLLKGNRLLSTGFTRESRREYKLWDLDNINKPLYVDCLDQTNAPLNIFYDPDLSMVYLVGKGDTVMRYYELNNEAPYFHYISTYQSSQPQRGMGFMPKRGCNVNSCEVHRMYKVLVSGSTGSIEPIAMTVPRKSELFQADIYPDTAANTPTLSMEAWFGGKDCEPKLMPMQQFYVEKDGQSSSKSGGLGGGLKKKGAGGGLKKVVAPAAAPASAPAAEAPKAAAPISSVKTPAARAPEPKASAVNNSQNQSGQIDDLLMEIANLKATVAQQEERIAALENRA